MICKEVRGFTLPSETAVFPSDPLHTHVPTALTVYPTLLRALLPPSPSPPPLSRFPPPPSPGPPCLILEALHQVVVAGVNQAVLKSTAGNVILDSNDGNSSLLLGSEAILGAAHTVTLRANIGPRLKKRISTDASALGTAVGTDYVAEGWAGDNFGGVGGGAGGGAYLNLTADAASLGGPAGKARVEVDDEEVCMSVVHTNGNLLHSCPFFRICFERPTCGIVFVFSLAIGWVCTLTLRNELLIVAL